MFLKNKLIFRKDKIVELCKNKSVLHLGFIQHAYKYEEMIKKDEWLHEKINKVAQELVGFDYLPDIVNLMKNRYKYEAYCFDVCRLQEITFHKKFDVVVCGELIEHVSNPGLMLDGIKKLMKDNSVLIITTPNPWANQRLRLLKKNILEDKWLNKEHVCWYSPQTLKQLLYRHNYEVIQASFYLAESKDKFIAQNHPVLKELIFIKRAIRPLFRPSIYFDGLFFLAKKKP